MANCIFLEMSWLAVFDCGIGFSTSLPPKILIKKIRKKWFNFYLLITLLFNDQQWKVSLSHQSHARSHAFLIDFLNPHPIQPRLKRNKVDLWFEELQLCSKDCREEVEEGREENDSVFYEFLKFAAIYRVQCKILNSPLKPLVITLLMLSMCVYYNAVVSELFLCNMCPVLRNALYEPLQVF